ncbi:hypothetical protein PIB30_043212 [Stylosanthes scabra]|uniref:Helicase C-terminal domain-containing protein n=1 Tax=Stylosanthes scabra TaxID=79078 RepID=A0ABU6YFS7_9FABA|nr:hypothetical protein [Stylosanthes scabra]
MLTKKRFLLASAAAAATAAASTYTFLQRTSPAGEPNRASFLSNFGGGKDESRGSNSKDLICIIKQEFLECYRTKNDADRLTHFLKTTVECEALHGNGGRDTSQTSLARFRDGDLNVLVASDDYDFASDGDDGHAIPNVFLAIHFDVPSSSEAFVCRSGITGRVSNLVVHEKDDESDAVIERDVGCDNEISHMVYRNKLADRVGIFLVDTFYAHFYRKYFRGYDD